MIFMKCTHVCAAQTTSKIEPDFPCLADEIAEPHPDINIKVTAFIKSKKFYFTYANGTVQDKLFAHCVILHAFCNLLIYFKIIFF